MLSKDYKLHFTISDPNFNVKKYPNSVNHGFLDHRDYLALMRSVQAVIGLGTSFCIGIKALFGLKTLIRLPLRGSNGR